MGRRNQRGLTLFELLVVLAILAFIAALVAPRVVGYLGRAKSDVAAAQASNIAAALELYFLDFERYPSIEEGLAVLTTAPSDTPQWRGPYLKDAAGLIDSWGRPFRYEVAEDGGSFTVVSFGQDGVEGGSGDDADIRRQ